MNLSIKNIVLLLLAVFCCSAFTACSDDDDNEMRVNEGVVFTLTRKLVYTTGVNEIGSVKITLHNGKEKVILPSLRLKGDEEMVKSEACALPAGNYKLIAYTAYSVRHEFLFDAELDSKNEFTVNSNEISEFKIPIKTKEILNYNFLRNSLMGLCRQVFGEDESIWPWNPKKYPYPDWEGLEFELDDYGSPMYLSGISFEGMKDGKPTAWAKMTAIPDGTLSNIAELATINVSDIPGFKQLPSDLDKLPSLTQISCINTGLEELPDNLNALTTLSGIFLINCGVTEFNYDLSALKELRVLSLAGNKMEKFATPLKGLNKLVSVDLSNNPLKQVDAACFEGDVRLNELNLAHTELDALPENLSKMTSLRGLDLSNNHFTAVPEVVNQLSGLKSLILDHNQLTNLSAAELSNMKSLECLSLAGNTLGEMPVLTNAHLAWLDVRGCGLNTAPQLSAYPELCVAYLGNNNFTTLPSGYFTSNRKMTILNLSDSPKLATLPSDLGLNGLDAAGHESFRLLEVENCANLHWTTPPAWQAYDFYQNNDWIFNLESGMVEEAVDNKEIVDYYGRVGIRRSNSPLVQIGK